MIASEVRGWDADLVVMATHASVGVARVELGSVAGGTLLHSPAPILFVSPHRSRARAPDLRAAYLRAVGSG